MANTEATVTAANSGATVTIETLGAMKPVAQAMLDELVVQSGWNQTSQDWAIFLRDGAVCAVRDSKGHIIASGAVLPMGGHVAWISMILVAPRARGQGLGTAVFEHCLSVVKAAGRTAYLDATPAGERIYSQFGFTPEFRLTRWERDKFAAAVPPDRTAKHKSELPTVLDKAALEALVALDTQALGVPRSALLADFLAREDTACLRSKTGFAIVRRGRIAHQIGPVLASDEAGGAALLARAEQSLEGKVFVDVPDERVLLCEQLRVAGFAPQRGFVRMVLGPQPLRGQATLIHAIAGPEFG
jgi:GNAT superfamily N-acetyltransferase